MTEKINNPHPGVIPGYTYGQTNGHRSPLADIELEQLKQSVMFTEDDERYLRLAGRILDDQIDDLLDVWYEHMTRHPFLMQFFSDPSGKPNGQYMVAVRRRFAQWIRDTCSKPYDRDWLNYMHEIGLRHHRTKKNDIDKVESTPVVNFRYLVAFIYPFTATVKPFLTNKGHNIEMVEKMYNAWFKSLTMQVALWSAPYVDERDY
jgi:hypothetical protein